MKLTHLAKRGILEKHVHSRSQEFPFASPSASPENNWDRWVLLQGSNGGIRKNYSALCLLCHKTAFIHQWQQCFPQIYGWPEQNELVNRARRRIRYNDRPRPTGKRGWDDSFDDLCASAESRSLVSFSGLLGKGTGKEEEGRQKEINWIITWKLMAVIHMYRNEI